MITCSDRQCVLKDKYDQCLVLKKDAIRFFEIHNITTCELGTGEEEIKDKLVTKKIILQLRKRGVLNK